MTFAQSLEALLRGKGVTAYRLSRETGFAESLISDWRHGRSMPNSDKLPTLAEYFGVSVEYLLGKRNSARQELSAGIPVLGVIRAGQPILCDEHIDSYEPASVKNPQDYFYLRVSGDSMEGAGIHDGSLVLVHKQPDAENGQIVACLLDGETATLKRFRRQKDMVLLLPENSAYEPILVPVAEFESGRAAILGVAVSVTNKLY